MGVMEQEYRISNEQAHISCFGGILIEVYFITNKSLDNPLSISEEQGNLPSLPPPPSKAFYLWMIVLMARVFVVL